MTIVIYALLDKRTHTCYVGQSKDFPSRLNTHLDDAFDPHAPRNVEKREWLHQAARHGDIQLRIVGECSLREDAAEIELRAMQCFKKQGWRLVNASWNTHVREKEVPPPISHSISSSLPKLS